MGGRGGSSGSGLPYWNNDCEASTSPADLNHTVLAPPKGAIYRPGEQIDISWQSGVRGDVRRIDGPPWAGGVHPISWQWSAFLESEDTKMNITILDNQNFTFGYDVAWQVLDDCSNTAINQTWTIPESFEVTEAVFNLVVVNMTNPDTRNSTTGPAFTIKAGSPTDAGSASTTASPRLTTGKPSFAVATATPTSRIDGSPTSTTPTSTLFPAPGDGMVSSQQEEGAGGGGQGLAVGAKTGIGAGVGVSALFFLLALFLFWKRRRRSGLVDGSANNVNSDEEKALEAKKIDAELPGGIAAVEAEAPVPRELPATSHGDDDDGKKNGEALSVNLDPYSPGGLSEPVEMPANEEVVVELPDNSIPHR